MRNDTSTSHCMLLNKSLPGLTGKRRTFKTCLKLYFCINFFFRSFIEGEDDDEELEQKQAPLCLNSDISYFGVGGKQAVFFIGNSTRV